MYGPVESTSHVETLVVANAYITLTCSKRLYTTGGFDDDRFIMQDIMKDLVIFVELSTNRNAPLPRVERLVRRLIYYRRSFTRLKPENTRRCSQQVKCFNGADCINMSHQKGPQAALGCKGLSMRDAWMPYRIQQGLLEYQPLHVRTGAAVCRACDDTDWMG